MTRDKGIKLSHQNYKNLGEFYKINMIFFIPYSVEKTSTVQAEKKVVCSECI